MSTAGSRRAEAKRREKEARNDAAKKQALADASVRKEDVLAKQAEQPPAKPQPTLTRKQKTQRQQGLAEQQATSDALAHPPSDEQVASGYKLKPGETPPLHVLNARAAQFAAAEKDEARAIANAVGKAAYETVQGIAPNSKHGRFRKLRNLRDEMEIRQRNAKQ